MKNEEEDSMQSENEKAEEQEHSNFDAFMAHLQHESTRDFGDCDAYQRIVKCWSIQLNDAVGSAYFEIDCEDEYEIRNGNVKFKFEAYLGPVNARKLIAFLRALPPEPDDDEPEAVRVEYTQQRNDRV